jgi:hypothetical protein
MDRLRPLSESECYTRLYGQRDPTVTIVAREPRARSGSSVTAEELRAAFDRRLDDRDGLGPAEAEAA